MAKSEPRDVSIGKFDILATYTFAHALADGMDEGEAKQRGMVAAVMGAQARLGIRLDEADYKSLKETAEIKKKTSITAESFDRRLKDKMGHFFAETFLPGMRKIVDAGLSYDDVKRILRIPSAWGAKISGEDFKERVAHYFERGAGKSIEAGGRGTQ
jgi:hypothetical protein